jgi:hypothetical protein
MTGFNSACHCIVIVDHLFGFAPCAEGRVAYVSKNLAFCPWTKSKMEAANYFETPATGLNLVLCKIELENSLNIIRL